MHALGTSVIAGTCLATLVVAATEAQISEKWDKGVWAASLLIYNTDCKRLSDTDQRKALSLIEEIGGRDNLFSPYFWVQARAKNLGQTWCEEVRQKYLSR